MEEVKEEIKFDKKNVIIGLLIVLVLAFLVATIVLAIPKDDTDVTYNYVAIKLNDVWYEGLQVDSYKIKGELVSLKLVTPLVIKETYKGYNNGKSIYEQQTIKELTISLSDCILYNKEINEVKR